MATQRLTTAEARRLLGAVGFEARNVTPGMLEKALGASSRDERRSTRATTPEAVPEANGEAKARDWVLRLDHRMNPTVNAISRALVEMPQVIGSYDSKTETLYAAHLAARQALGELRWWAHPLELRLPGGVHYTPDFVVERNGRLELHEVKGRLWRADAERMRPVKEIYPDLSLWIVTHDRKSNGWDAKRY